jgi:hypothetical protein
MNARIYNFLQSTIHSKEDDQTSILNKDNRFIKCIGITILFPYEIRTVRGTRLPTINFSRETIILDRLQ